MSVIAWVFSLWFVFAVAGILMIFWCLAARAGVFYEDD